MTASQNPAVAVAPVAAAAVSSVRSPERIGGKPAMVLPPGAVAGPETPGARVAGESARASGPRTWVIEMPPGTPIISANHRMNRWARNQRTQALKSVIATLARQQLPVIARADITVEYASPPRLRRMRHPLASDAISDSDNIAPTGKALADGIVKAGVFRTDSRKCVRKVTYILSPETHPRGLLRVHITEVAP